MNDMTNEMPNEIYVFEDADGGKDDFWAKPVAPEFDYGFQNQTKYIRSDKAVPEGWKLVPIKPTKNMYDHGVMAKDVMFATGARLNTSYFPVGAIYEAMLSAAPQPPTKED